MIQVLIVDDQELFRESLKVVLGVSPEIAVTDAVPGVAEALRSAARFRPDMGIPVSDFPCSEWVFPFLFLITR